MNSEKITTLSTNIYNQAVKNGWWDSDRTWKETRILIVSEVAELLESFRNNIAFEQCDKDIPLDYFYEELADITIRLLDYTGKVMEKSHTHIFSFNSDRTINSNIAIALDTFVNMIYDYLHGTKEEEKYFAVKSIHLIGYLEALAIKFTGANKLWQAVAIKHKFNQTRGYKHGKEF